MSSEAHEVGKPAFSLVIPAHNEEKVLPRLLLRLGRELSTGEAEVVVVANGCTDATASVARAVPGIHVIEIATASKSAALNAGDAAARAYPRIFLDADIGIDGEALRRLASILDSDAALVAAPVPFFELSGATWGVRRFYECFAKLPYVNDGLVGLGVYGLSEAGRRRFAAFPDVIADDLYVQSLFAPEERRVSSGRFAIKAPRTLPALIRVRTRIARGNRQLSSQAGALELRTGGSTSVTVRHLITQLVREPKRVLPVMVYGAVTVAARLLARRAGNGWERDESSRSLDAAPRKVPIDGTEFDNVSLDEVATRVVGGASQGAGGTVVTPNVDFLRQLHADPSLRHLVDDATVVVADGMPIIWASRLAGVPLRERVAGSSLVGLVLEAGAAAGLRFLIIGGAPGAARRAIEAVRVASPGGVEIDWHSPPLGFESSPEKMEEILTKLHEVRPQVVLVALGFPKQERLMERLSGLFPGTWFIGCGGTIDMIAGDKRRAPTLLQALGLEWAFRLLQEPVRLGPRYLRYGAPYAVGMLARAFLQGRLGRSPHVVSRA
jgi:exopolysaccharide biosynthesis WecB/TagA/CpsF family protein